MEFSKLIGKTFSKVKQVEDEIHFILDNGKGYKLFHVQDCCESVYIESIVGSLSDLENNPILLAEVAESEYTEASESGTWTFYKLATIKGYVDIRFLGESNGYYSESVSFGSIR